MSNLQTIDLNLEARLQDWKGVKHLTCLVKLVFYHIIQIVYTIQEQVMEK